METTASTEFPWWTEDADHAVNALETSENGLSSDEAASRLEAYGPNELAAEPTRPLWLVFLSQFANTMIVVLLVAAGITVAIGEGQDAIVILAIVILNAVIGFVQEYRAEQAMMALQQMAAPNARALRNSVEVVLPASELVPGDIVLLDTGDIIPADVRLFESPSLRVDEAPLTGESVPVDKVSSPITAEEGEVIGDRRNMAFKGTSVVYGRGRGVVVATGMQTALGQIAGLLKAHKSPPTPLQKRLAVLGRWLAFAAVVVCLIVFTAGVLRGEDVTFMFLVAVSLAVAAIPEALPAVVTISLALGAQRMVKQNALVRKLPAVETLGSVTVICSDKTGTLTEGRMTVERFWTMSGEVEASGEGYSPIGTLTRAGEHTEIAAGSPEAALLTTAALCNDSALVLETDDAEEWTAFGDPTEAALLAMAARGGFDREDLAADLPRIAEEPFDADRRLMTTVHSDTSNGVVTATKGGVEAVAEITTSIFTESGVHAITEADIDEIMRQAAEYADGGFRVLAMAGSQRSQDWSGNYEEDLTFYGLAAMADPARPESKAAVDACRTAGITPVMITGDHPATGKAIANRLGFGEGREVLTGGELARIAHEDLPERVRDVAVYARTSPEQKLDIVQAWQANGEIVSMTGDGVNDAPALRTADIGVAMGVTGTEVAKEAAEMVLTDDNFSTIVTAVGEGRRIYDNIRRFVRYTLTSNSGEIWVMFLGPFLGLPLPLLPVHILWINLVTDGLPGLALGTEPAERNVMKRAPRPPNESIFAKGLWQHVMLVGLLMGAVPLALGVWGDATGRPWQTMVFASLAMLQLFNAMAVRSEVDSLWTLGLRSNKPLLAAVLGTAALQLLAIYWTPMQSLLHLDPLSGFELVVVMIASTIVFFAVEAEKAIKRRMLKRRPVEPSLA